MKLNNKFIFFTLIFFSFLLFTSAKQCKQCNRKPRMLLLTSIHIIDRNGLTESTSNKERLNQYQNVDFLQPQQYQKVLRIYERDSVGNIRSFITTYHENGNIKEYLEILNGRATGFTHIWHENGILKASARLVGGTPEVTDEAKKTWIFDGNARSWSDDNILIADFSYSRGSLEGISIYYHPTGELKKKVPYCKNLQDGTEEIFYKNGQLLQEANYSQGKKHGKTTRYWQNEKISALEEYCNGQLQDAEYFDQNGNLVAEIKNGEGVRAEFGKNYIRELQEFKDGMIDGKIQIFNPCGVLECVYHVKDGDKKNKHGEEIVYYNQLYSTSQLQPQLLMNWHEGKMQGVVKSWYPNGQLEHQRENANTRKNGMLISWYKTGEIMLIEEYDQDKLVKGEYYRKNEKNPVSYVKNGQGTATIYNGDGHFVHKVKYQNGKPEN
ncbi:MAG: hypothetical protein Q8K60_01700 [Parachlamydiaceae bacterium]|nr:hypothetical protein [Parachlamydiaceae bacterium]